MTGGLGAALAVLIVIVALLLSLPLLRSTMPLPIDFGEGWNAYMADQAARGAPLYAASGSLSPNNYPPLSFELVGRLHALTGMPSLVLGRILSLGALVVVMFEIFWAAWLSGAAATCGAIGAVVFVGLMAAAAPRYVGMNDPQLLAHVLVDFGFVLYLMSVPRNRWWMVPLTAATIATGLFTKHNLIAVPIAIALDLAFVSPRLAVLWVAALATAGGVLGGLLAWHHGGVMFANILTPRRYSVVTLVQMTATALAAVAIPLAAMASASWVHIRGSHFGRESRLRARPVALYVAVSLAVGVVFSGGSGADLNMFFSLFIAVCIGLAVALTALRERRRILGIVAAAVVASLAVAVPLRVLTPQRYRMLQQRQADTRADVGFLGVRPGDAFCEQMMLCYLAGKPLVLQPYFAPELIAARRISAASVSALFERRRFSVVQLDGPLPTDAGPGERTARRLPAPVLNAIAHQYRLVRVSSNGALYVPNPVLARSTP